MTCSHITRGAMPLLLLAAFSTTWATDEWKMISARIEFQDGTTLDTYDWHFVYENRKFSGIPGMAEVYRRIDRNLQLPLGQPGDTPRVIAEKELHAIEVEWHSSDGKGTMKGKRFLTKESFSIRLKDGETLHYRFIGPAFNFRPQTGADPADSPYFGFDLNPASGEERAFSQRERIRRVIFTKAPPASSHERKR